jgi:hypothetical protein
MNSEPPLTEHMRDRREFFINKANREVAHMIKVFIIFMIIACAFLYVIIDKYGSKQCQREHVIQPCPIRIEK